MHATIFNVGCPILDVTALLVSNRLLQSDTGTWLTSMLCQHRAQAAAIELHDDGKAAVLDAEPLVDAHLAQQQAPS